MKIELLVAALAMMGLGAIVRAAPRPAARPGLDLDKEKERKLADTTGTILDALAGTKPDYEAVVRRIREARSVANELVAMAEKTRPRDLDTPGVPARSPVVVPQGCEAEEVLAAWKEQLVLRLRSVNEVLIDPNKGTLPKWGEAIGVGWRDRDNLPKRARPLAATMREAEAFAMLLAREPEVIRVARGEVLFEDDLKQGTDDWYLYGPCITTQDEKGLRRKNKRVRHSDSVTWSKKEFGGNFLYEFTFIANNVGKAGVLFPICGRPVKKGTDLSVSAGETMDSYNLGVHAYHFSVHRSETGICNGRKVGTGLHLIGSRTPDPCEDVGKPYRIAVGKWDNVIFFLVDGKLQHSYYDAGTFGPALEAGSVGTRHWGGADSTYADVTVSRLIREEEKKDESAPKEE